MGMKGILFGSTFNLAGSLTQYVGICVGAGQVWLGTESNLQQVMPVAGTFDYLRLKCTDPGGSSQSRAFTVRLNGADTTLTATLNTGSTLISDTTHSFSVVAGDLVGMKQVTSASPASVSVCTWATRFTAANNNEFPLLWGSSAGAGAGTTRYSPVQGDAVVNATEANVQSVVPTPGVISSLYVNLDANMVTAGQTVTLFLNGVATALTCTVGSGSASANDTTHTVNIAAGDTISLEWNNAGSNAPRPRAGMKFAPTTDGESVAFVPSISTASAFTTNWSSPYVGTGAGEANRQVPMIACSLKKLYTIALSLGSGQNFITTARVNTADSTLTNTIAGTASANNDTTHSVTVVDDDLFALKSNNTAGSGGPFRYQMGVVLFITPSGGGGSTVPPFQPVIIPRGRSVTRASNY